jgi:protein SCO1/2
VAVPLAQYHMACVTVFTGRLPRAIAGLRGLGRIAVAMLMLGLMVSGLAGCGGESPWHETDVTGSLPALDFTMTRASDGKTVTAKDFAGKVVLLYFGYTFCPDICPLTLANVSRVLRNLGDKAKDVRVLFVTVDPNRDTLPVLKKYTESFGPEVVGLRGNADQIAALAKRYRVAYSVTPEKDGKPYTVTHSSAIYVFDQTGKVRLLITSMAAPTPDIDGATADLGTLVDQGGSPSFWQRLWQMV